MANEPTEASFLKDVAEHRMTVLLDSGVYRSIRFSKPGTVCYSFTLSTFPGHLVITGDMGSWVFERLHDMLEFFRTDRKGEGLRINLRYWSEKLVAANVTGRFDGGATEYCPDTFRQEIWNRTLILSRRLRDTGAEWSDIRGLIDEAKDARNAADDGEYAAHKAARDFSYQFRGRTYEFSDFWETNLRRYRYHFIWACYAIAWGVKQYDAHAQKPVHEEA